MRKIKSTLLGDRAMALSDFKAIIEAAIKIEEQSFALYKGAKEKVRYQSSKEFLEELAQEELKHKKKLLAVLRNEKQVSTLGSQAKKIQNLKIVDPMRAATLSHDADYQRILIFAAKREKATHDYYKSLAQGLEGSEAGGLFSRLADEELTHKNRLEREYDEYILWQN